MLLRSHFLSPMIKDYSLPCMFHQKVPNLPTAAVWHFLYFTGEAISWIDRPNGPFNSARTSRWRRGTRGGDAENQSVARIRCKKSICWLRSARAWCVMNMINECLRLYVRTATAIWREAVAIAGFMGQKREGDNLGDSLPHDII